MRRLRRALATWVWWLAVAAALLLAVGALMSNVFQDREAAVVRQVLDAAAFVAGPFDDLFHFYESGTTTTPRAHDVPREDLVNWGLAAVACLVVGRGLDALLRPRAEQVAGAEVRPQPGPAEPDGAAGESEASQQSP